jgi:hypothetical protein
VVLLLSSACFTAAQITMVASYHLQSHNAGATGTNSGKTCCRPSVVEVKHARRTEQQCTAHGSRRKSSRTYKADACCVPYNRLLALQPCKAQLCTLQTLHATRNATEAGGIAVLGTAHSPAAVQPAATPKPSQQSCHCPVMTPVRAAAGACR